MSFNANKKELLNIILGIKKRNVLNDFLVDLLTPQEMKDVVKRWQIVKALYSGLNQRDISKNLRVGLAKVTRGSRMLLNQNGGFNKVLRNKKVN